MKKKILVKASVPLLMKKISEDLEYLKESIDIVRENPQCMANELLSKAMNCLDSYKFDEVCMMNIVCTIFYLVCSFIGLKTFRKG